MKKICIIFFVLLFHDVYAQKESVFITFGKPWFPDKELNSRNFSFGLNYQNRFSESFGFDVGFEYAQSNNLPSFLNDNSKLDVYILNQNDETIFINTLWSKINTFTIFNKINYQFVNNEKFYFNFNFGLGLLFSYSKSHDLESYSYNLENGDIISYKNSINSDNLNTFFYSLGLQFHYTFYKNYFIGINPQFLMPFGEKKLNTIPVYPNHYNLSISLGKIF